MIRSTMKAKRRALNLTQRELAEKVGITRTYYTEIENGNRNCGIEIWLRIGAALKADETELVSFIKEGLTEKGVT